MMPQLERTVIYTFQSKQRGWHNIIYILSLLLITIEVWNNFYHPGFWSFCVQFNTHFCVQFKKTVPIHALWLSNWRTGEWTRNLSNRNKSRLHLKLHLYRPLSAVKKKIGRTKPMRISIVYTQCNFESYAIYLWLLNIFWKQN